MMMDKEIEKLTEAIKCNPGSAKAYFNRGVAYIEKGEWDKAITDYDKAIKLDPQDWDAYFCRGLAYAKKGEWDKSIADFNKSIELAPESFGTYFNRGRSYAQKREWDNSIADFNKAIELAPESFDAYFNLGLSYAQKGELDNAIAAFDKTIELNSEYMYAYHARGIVYIRKGELDKAITDFNKTIELDPQNWDAYFNRGVAYGQKRELDEAITNFNKTIELTPQNSDAHFNCGLAHAQKGEWDKAIKKFDEVIKLVPQHPGAFHLCGFCYFSKGEHEKAFEKFIQADEIAPSLKSIVINIYVASRINDATRDISWDTKGKVITNYFELLSLISEIQGTLFYKPQEPAVAHYTSLDTLKTLVNKTPFRLYNSTYMNDPEEGHIFFDVMKKLPEESGIDLEDMFYGEDDEMSYRSPAYIGSFVELDESEQKDKLFLWRTYGKHNSEDAAGGCLIFPRDGFVETYLPQVGTMSQHIRKSTDLESAQSGGLEEKQNSKPPIYKTVYIGKDKDKNIFKGISPKSSQKLLTLLSELAQCLKVINCLVEKNIIQNDAKNKLKQLTCELLDGIRFLFKASDYREEQEVRVIQFHYHDESQEKESDKIKADMEQIPPRFYLEAPKDFRCNEVILGPMARNLQDWKWWIEKQNPDLKVNKSKIKYENYNS